MSTDSKKTKVCIVGGGAAGIAAAWSLSRFPEKYEVQLWEKQKVTGGQATSEDMSVVNSYINDGVQGGPFSYRNTLALHRKFGFEPQPVAMKISFGKGQTNWTNYSETELVKRLKKDIKRFEKTIKTISRFEAVFAFLPIHKVLRWFKYSDDFVNLMVLPLVALFFGTGNQTPYVSSAMIARVFLDPDLRIFDYDSELLLSQQPKMFAFEKLQTIYEKLAKDIKGQVYLNRPVKSVKRSKKGALVTDNDGKSEWFDYLIFACDPETIIKITSDLTWLERRILGNVKFFDDVTVTHTDEEYMHKYYEIDLKNRNDQYLVKTDPNDPKKIDMSFNLSFYQPQLKDKRPYIYQTIFLNKLESEKWTKNEIKKEKVLLEKWWRQMSHTWRHYATFVPFQWLIQGTKRTYYSGSYTLVNTHEIATISGFAAAERIGAPYPFKDDPLGKKQFDGYCTIVHGKFLSPRASAIVKFVLFGLFILAVAYLLRSWKLL